MSRSNKSNQSRREFVVNSGKLLAGGMLLPAFTLSAQANQKGKSANNKIHIALIGCRGIGWANLNAFMRLPEVECVALCDIDDSVLTQRAAEFESITGKKPQLYKDFRKLLDKKDIDIVIIATPDHWHCLMTVMACQAGKDVYVEKPLANSIAECFSMVKAQQKYGRVVQVGQWQRSNQHWKDATDYVRQGKLGKIRAVKAWIYNGNKGSVPDVPDSTVPEGVDYDMWLGPAPARPFNSNRFHFTFRWYWDYAGGLMTDWGVHLIDMALMGMDAKIPKSVVSIGGKFAYPNDAMETPDTQTAIYEFSDFSLTWEHTIGISNAPYGRQHGVTFVGELGTLIVDREQWMVVPETDGKRYKVESLPIQKASDNGLNLHVANFIDCVKNRNTTPNCSIETAANTAIVAHMGNIAYRTGKRVFWDNDKKLFNNDVQANALVKPMYRAPWKFPTIQ
jgi:predicted dehydrogenase